MESRKEDEMIRLTNAQDGEALMLNIHHIVAIRESGKQVFILTTTGVEYAVKESSEKIGKLPIWKRL
jgi:uncharacterized protein YlzI (FlbEa/FlbD family)